MRTQRILWTVAALWCATSVLSAFAIDPDAVVGMWLFDENGGKVARDGSGNGLDGTIAGSEKWTKGMFDGGLEFDGSSVYVEVGSDPSLVLEELTIVAWGKISPSAGTRWQSIMMRGQDPRNYLMVVDKDSQKLQLSITKGAPGAWGGPIAGPAITDEEWHHLAAVIGQSAGLVVYVDGVQVGQQPYAKPSLDANPNVMRIGDGSSGGHQLDGALDEVALFSVPLTADEINEVMTDGLGEATGFLSVKLTGKLATTWASIKR
ncbi:MAG: LamG domain-containing protein [Candidatus Poribacteria bacterium]|nr:LamG domain-containing protein [Candidatus Poribacteria bacterium]